MSTVYLWFLSFTGFLSVVSARGCEGAFARSAVRVTPLVTGDMTVVVPPPLLT
jgi:hypothetical protein